MEDGEPLEQLFLLLLNLSLGDGDQAPIRHNNGLEKHMIDRKKIDLRKFGALEKVKAKAREKARLVLNMALLLYHMDSSKCMTMLLTVGLSG